MASNHEARSCRVPMEMPTGMELGRKGRDGEGGAGVREGVTWMPNHATP